MPDQVKPKGILRNRSEVNAPSVSDKSTSTAGGSEIISSHGTSEPFDRSAVLENTLANAKIHTVGNAIIQKHKSELVDELQGKTIDDEDGEPKNEHLKWNEANLYLNEQEKSATMKITEPKTPFQGSIGDSEYYRPDEEDDEVNLDAGRGPSSLDELEAEGFMLGEPEVSGPDPTIQPDRILVDEKAKAAAAQEQDGEEEEEEEEEEGEEEEETPEERHKRFEQMRKSHYFMKGAVLHKKLEDLDDDEN